MTEPEPQPTTLQTGLLAGAAVLLAAVVRLAVLPVWSRSRFDGHERLLVAAFEGRPPDASTQALPATLWLSGALGALGSDPRLLLVPGMVAGCLGVGAVVLWTRRRFGLGAAAWAGLFVALLPEHAAWATSPTPVMLGLSLLLGAFALEGRGRLGELGAAGLVALACAFRPELAVLGLLRGWPGLAGVLVGALHLWWLPGVEPSSPWVALQVNLPMVRFLGPPVLLLALAGLPAAWPLLAAAAWVHLSGSLFDDYGPRHALLGGVALCVACGVAASRRGPWSWLLGGVVLLGLGRDLAQQREVWQQRTPPAVPAGLTRLGGAEQPVLPEGCVEVSEEPPIAGQPIPSHLRFFTGELAADCVLWGEEDQHAAWTSRSLRPRAQRMRTLYRLEPVGVWEPGRGRSVRLYHRLERRW